MEEHFKDDTFLARWVAGELTEEELEAFKKSEDYLKYFKINEEAQKLKAPKFDKDAAFNNLIQQLDENNENKKVKKLLPNWIYAAAAVLLIALGIYNISHSSTRYQTDYGQQLAVVLPDNSKVQLNANSQLEFSEKSWKKTREVKLKGEAFFEVEKGESFKVLTPVGTVEVLGTKFNVISRDNYFEVRCHKGRVLVKGGQDIKTILTPGKAVRIINAKKEEWTFSKTKPTWLQGEITFNKTPLEQVIKALENQFGVSFDISKIDIKQRFTGGFPNKDLNSALKLVFTPMDISYTVKDDNTIILVNKSNKYKEAKENQ